MIVKSDATDTGALPVKQAHLIIRKVHLLYWDQVLSQVGALLQAAYPPVLIMSLVQGSLHV